MASPGDRKTEQRRTQGGGGYHSERSRRGDGHQGRGRHSEGSRGGGGGRGGDGRGGGGRGGKRINISRVDFPLPGSTTELLTRQKSEFKKVFDSSVKVHPGLLLTKLMPWEFSDRPQEADAEYRFNNMRFGYQRVDKARERISYVAKSVNSSERGDLAEAWLRRRNSWVEQLEKSDLARKWTQKCSANLVLWLSAASPAEMGFCLHHVYGIPYLPGSALKGVARSFAYHYLAGRFPVNYLSGKFTHREMDLIFGPSKKNKSSSPENDGNEKDSAGRVVFLDGIPSTKPCMEMDVMTPHHSSYYGDPENRSPHDCENPVPVSFMRIKKNSCFEVGVIKRTSAMCGSTSIHGGDSNFEHLLDLAKELLINSLSLLGLGAKTTSGYGILSYIEPSIR